VCYDRSVLAQVAAVVSNLPAMQETQETVVQSLHWEGPLEEEMATLSSTPAWEIPRTEEPGSPRSCKEVDTTEHTHTHTHTHKLKKFKIFYTIYIIILLTICLMHCC